MPFPSPDRTAARLAGDPRFLAIRCADEPADDPLWHRLGEAAVLALWAVACAVLLFI